jgi:DNA primase
MREVAERYGLRFNSAGFALCPFHSERTPSFKIHNGRGHCFGCGWHGDAIDFVQQLQGIGREEAVRTLIRDFALPIPLETGLSIRQRQQLYARSARLQAERRREAREEQRQQEAYLEALDLFILLDRWKRDYAPRSPDEPIDRRYTAACLWLDWARETSIERG